MQGAAFSTPGTLNVLGISHTIVFMKSLFAPPSISPWLFSILLLCLTALAALAVSPPAHAASPLEKRYEATKQEMERLRADPRRSTWREPWQKISRDFLDIYEQGKNWSARPAALFRAAVAEEEIARRSMLRADAQAAADLYQRLAKEDSQSVLADDALLQAAKIKAELQNDRAGAESLLKKNLEDYPSGDMAAATEQYRSRLNGTKEESPVPPVPTVPTVPALVRSGEDKTPDAASLEKKVQASTSATLQQVSWQSRRNRVKIVLEFDRPVTWHVQSQTANPKTGSPLRLLVDVANAAPEPKIRPGVKIADSLLTRMRLDLSSPGHTRMLLDFSALKKFSVTTETSPFRLVINATANDAALAGAVPVGRSVQSEEPVRAANGTLPMNIAKQLGLSVRSVIIDAGHGGKDPGTSHNGVVERELTLDIAKRVGALLAAKGLKIHYSRTNNTWISLEARSQKANEVKADLMISIHVNASTNPSASGLETYFLNFASSSEAVKLAGVENAMSDRKLGELEGLLADLMLGARTQESRRLAKNIQGTTLARLDKKGYETRDGGTKSAPFHVLLGSGMPGVLIEVGYCTNSSEAKRLASSAYRAALADGIASGILVYAGKLAQ